MHPSPAPAEPTAVQNEPQGPSCPRSSQYNGAAPLVQGADPDCSIRANPDAPPRCAGPASRKRRALGAKGAMEHPETKVTILPPAGREEQAELWGLTPDRLGDHLFTGDRRGHGPDDAVDVDHPGDDAEDERALEERGFVLEGGWTPVAIKNNRLNSGGLTAHRGVLHADEYVDAAVLRAAVEVELGFTYEQVRSVYKQGPKSVEKRELRARIDARLLALSRAGGQMLELARALGWKVEDGGPSGGANCRTMERAIERARKEES